MANRTLISIVDDDQPFRESMRKLVTLLGYTVEEFPSAADFLASPLLPETGCLIADVHMPGMTGDELHRRLIKLDDEDLERCLRSALSPGKSFEENS